MIALTYHGYGFKELRRRLDPKLVDKALNTAIQRTAMKVRTFVSKDVRAKYAVKAGDIGKTVQIRKVNSGGRISRLVAYAGQGIPLDKFGAKPKKVKSSRGPRRGVSVRIRKDRRRRVVRGGFIADKNGNKVFKRSGADRLPVIRLLGPSIPQMVSNKITTESVNAKIGDELPVEFRRAMDRFLPKG